MSYASFCAFSAHSSAAVSYTHLINNNWFIGQALGVIYGYQSAGLWKEEDAAEMAKFNEKGHKFEAGMVRPVDQNNDHLIDPNDDRVVIGCLLYTSGSIPKSRPAD